MKITLEVRGLSEATRRLTRMERKTRGLRAIDVFGEAMGEIHRFAISVSPYATGAYQWAHRIVMGKEKATLSIDPAARNPDSGQPVIRYAGAVEDMYQVYGRTAAVASSLANRATRRIIQEVLG